MFSGLETWRNEREHPPKTFGGVQGDFQRPEMKSKPSKMKKGDRLWPSSTLGLCFHALKLEEMRENTPPKTFGGVQGDFQRLEMKSKPSKMKKGVRHGRRRI